MRIKYILSFLAFLFFVNVLLAQTTEKQASIVYLKGGSIFKGEIIEYVQGGVLKLKLANSEAIILLDGKDVKKIIHGEVGEVFLQKQKKAYRFKERGFYNATYMNLSVAGSAYSSSRINFGYGVQTSFGYQFNRLLGAGLGIGMDYYYEGSGQNLMPVFGEIRGYLFPKNFTPMYILATGYGFAFKDEDRNITEAKGGWMIHPAIGFRMGGSKLMNFTLDAGVKIQKAEYTFVNWDTRIQKITYKRLVIRVGFIF